jgi:RNA polymerase sigma factor (sigma-70 family)
MIRVSEGDLIVMAMQGDTRAFDKLSMLHKKRVVAFCSHFLENWEEGEQVAQDTFVSAWRNLKDYRGEGLFIVWVLRIAQNKCINEIRTRKNYEQRHMISLDDPEYYAVVDTQILETNFQNQCITHVHSQFINKELHDWVTTHSPIWDQLDWDIFLLRVGKGEDNSAEIARLLGKTADTVKYRYHAHIQKSFLAVRKELVIKSMQSYPHKLSEWDALDWALLRMVYRDGCDFEATAARLRLSQGMTGITDPSALKRRYEAHIQPIVSALEEELGSI